MAKREIDFSDYQNFKRGLDADSLLDEAIEFASAHLSPDQVFEKEDLISWAEDLDPDDVFSDSKLEDWAEENGFVKERED